MRLDFLSFILGAGLVGDVAGCQCAGGQGVAWPSIASTIAAIVTGGASGLGAATARRLAAQGVKVALFDFNAELGEQVAREIGGVFCQVDVTCEEQVDAAFARAPPPMARSASWSTAPTQAMPSRPRVATR